MPSLTRSPLGSAWRSMVMSKSLRRHDAVADFLLDQELHRQAVHQHQLVKAVDERVGTGTAPG